MRIGIVPELYPSRGGEYQYGLTLLEALATLAQQKEENEFILFLWPEFEPFLTHLSGVPWKQVSLLPPPPFKERALDLLRAWAGEGWLRQAWRRMRHVMTPPASPDPEQIRRRPEFTRWFRRHGVNWLLLFPHTPHLWASQFRRHGVDWLLYTNPNPLSFEVGLPYVMPVHDIGHRVHPEFPSYTGCHGEWREYLLRNGTRYATLILADSEVGKEQILEFYGPYGITSDRVKILPFLPANYLSVDISESECARVRGAYRLPERYLFYPAQFWPEKNHAGIVQALGLLKEELGVEIHVVFCGSHNGEFRERHFQEVMAFAHRLGVDHQVHCLGYVPNEDMSGLYVEAVGLVMPTLGGPTNIPILEAWAFGCPVLTSDIPGIREQVGDAGLLVNPYSVELISRGIYRLWMDEALCRELGERGRRRLASYTPEDFRRRLADIVQEANERVRQGKCPVYGMSGASNR
jgi:glycosyltransferase involved in cell wall biosynthesis